MLSNKTVIFGFLLTITASCGKTLHVDTLTPLASSDKTGPFLSYIVMPEQECPAKLNNNPLVYNDIVHPSAKMCFYSP